MGKTDLELFKQALTEGLARRAERELASCSGEAVICSAAHLRKMDKIINNKRIFNPSLSLGKAKVAAVLVASTLLLASCATVYKDEIREFIKTVYEDHFSISYPSGDDDLSTIEVVYEMTYLPEGYTLREEVLNEAYSYYFYENEEGDMITFMQMPLNTSFGFGDDFGEGETLYIGKQKVFYRKNDLSNTYLWNDGKYAMMIETDFPIEKSELEKIIDGVDKAK